MADVAGPGAAGRQVGTLVLPEGAAAGVGAAADLGREPVGVAAAGVRFPSPAVGVPGDWPEEPGVYRDGAAPVIEAGGEAAE